MLTPGDSKALEQGCVCPAEQNQHGAGTYNVVSDVNQTFFLVAEDCPLHGQSNWKESIPE